MARQRVSQLRLGEAMGISQQQVSARLNGRIAFDTAELDVVAEFLRVPVSQFIGETHPGPTHPTPTGPPQPPMPRESDRAA